MPAFCGVWRLSKTDARHGPRLGPSAALAELLGCAANRITDFQDGPLSLGAAKESWARDGRRCFALSGYADLPGALSDGLQAALAASPAFPEAALLWNGQYGFVFAHPEEGLLKLFRTANGAAPIYYAQDGGALLFSDSLRLVLRLRGGGTLDRETVFETLSNGRIVFGDRTPLEGVRELMPGHVLTCAKGKLSLRLSWHHALDAPEPSREPPASRFRALAGAAVRAAIGRNKTVAVALSGGIDSTSLCLCAVEQLGAANVRGFTVEFEDPNHPSEVGFARAFCRRLGIAHQVLRISYRDFVRVLPELIWRSEVPAGGILRQGPAFMLMSQAAKSAGLPLLLTGCGAENVLGINKHLPLLDRLARVMLSAPDPERSLRLWFGAHEARAQAQRHEEFHREPASLLLRLRYMILGVLKHNDIIGRLEDFYPPLIRSEAVTALESRPVLEAVAAIRQRSLFMQMRFLEFLKFTGPTISGPARTSAAETGAALASPFAYRLCEQWARHGHWYSRGTFKGRDIQRKAFSASITEDILSRPKDRQLGVIPWSWISRLARSLDPLMSSSPVSQHLARPAWGVLQESCRSFVPHFVLWHRLFVERGLRAPPSWDALDIDPKAL